MTDIRPGIYNIDLFQGEEFEVTLIFQVKYSGISFPIDTSDEVILQVKEDRKFAPLFTLVLGNGLSITGENALKIFMAPILTRRLHASRYHYDILFMTEDGVRPRYYIRGQINVTNTISKPE